MSVDRDKVLEAAQKHLAKGAYDKAIAELQKLVAADPTDVRTWLKIGDLHAKKGANREAADTYERVADQYSAQGFFLKAVAVHKQILKLDPQRLGVLLKLGGAYEQLQLVNDALTTYEAVAAAYARLNDAANVVSTLARMVDLDPENLPVRIKHAEALSKAARTEEAAKAFDACGALLKAQGRIDDYLKVAERLLFHRPDDTQVAKEVARLYLDRHDAKRALSKLQICFKADPKDVSTLELLASAFHQLGQLPKTLSVYREIARIHGDAKRTDERLRTLRTILELDPGDTDARDGLAEMSRAAGGGAAVRRDIAPPAFAVVASAPPPEPELEPTYGAPEETYASDDLEAADELEVDGEELVEEYDDAQVAAAENALESLPPEPLDEADEEELFEVEEAEPEALDASPAPDSVAPEAIDEALEGGTASVVAKLLSECDAFQRFGLKQRVEDHLRRVLDLDPLHVEARERLKDMLIDRGDVEGAVDELFVLADRFTAERPSLASLYLRQIVDLDPEHETARGRLNSLAGRVSMPPPAAPAASEIAPERTIVASLAQLEMLRDAQRAQQTAAATSPGDPAPNAAWEAEFAEGDDPSRDALEPPAPNLPTPVAPPPDAVEAEAVRLAEEALLAAPMSPVDFAREPSRPSPEPALRDSSSGRMSAPPGEVEDLLDEVDFYVSQSLWDEALTTLRDAARTYPRNRLIADKLAEIEELAAEAPAEASATSEPPAEQDDQSFEFAERLAEEVPEAPKSERKSISDASDVEQVFAQFKKGVEAQVGLEDTETHYDLGIAYKEMGLLDDAIAEFALCIPNAQKACIAHTMIGLCHIERGDLAEAVKQFKKGLYAEWKSDREELALYFELGRAHDAMQDPQEALFYYEKVRKRDPSFRGVKDRIDALMRPSLAPAAPVTSASDDVDAAFDDLMGD